MSISIVDCFFFEKFPESQCGMSIFGWFFLLSISFFAFCFQLPLGTSFVRIFHGSAVKPKRYPSVHTQNSWDLWIFNCMWTYLYACWMKIPKSQLFWCWWIDLPLKLVALWIFIRNVQINCTYLNIPSMSRVLWIFIWSNSFAKPVPISTGGRTNPSTSGPRPDPPFLSTS